MSAMTEFVISFGYLAVFAGALLEGEVTLVAAGFAAQLGILDLYVVISVGTLGAALGDQAWFLMGRWRGRALIGRLPALRATDSRIRAALNRHPTAAIVMFRFLCGLRTAGALMMGAADIRAAKFSALNVLSAAVWASAIAGASYSIGSAIEGSIGDLRYLQAALVTTLVLAAASYWLSRRVGAQS